MKDLYEKVCALADEAKEDNLYVAAILCTLAGAMAGGEEPLLAESAKQFALGAIARMEEGQVTH